MINSNSSKEGQERKSYKHLSSSIYHSQFYTMFCKYSSIIVARRMTYFRTADTSVIKEKMKSLRQLNLKLF